MNKTENESNVTHLSINKVEETNESNKDKNDKAWDLVLYYNQPSSERPS